MNHSKTVSSFYLKKILKQIFSSNSLEIEYLDVIGKEKKVPSLFSIDSSEIVANLLE